MLIDSVIIVLREVIAVAFLASVLLALAYYLRMPAPGLRATTALGLVAALLFDVFVRALFDRFDGFGYELATVALDALIWMTLLAVIAVLAITPKRPQARAVLARLMSAALLLAITREGSEILVYFSSLSRQEDAISDALTGAVIGVGVGFSAGTLFYYLQLAQRPDAALRTGAILLALIGSGICAQGSLLLIQADLLPAQTPLWDSSDWVQESSPLGQLLYALIGYEATPSPLMVGVWLGSMAIALSAALGGRHLAGRRIAGVEGHAHDPRRRP